MTMKKTKTNYDQEWLKKEVMKDELMVNSYKQRLIESIRQTKKETIFEHKKITLWTRIKRTLGF